MSRNRVYRSADFLRPSQGEPIRSVITESAEAVIVAWHVQAGQKIAPHVHPQGQDTWTILAGRGDYQLDALGTSVSIGPGDVVVAPRGAVHGVRASGAEALIFVSVVSPGSAGFELVEV